MIICDQRDWAQEKHALHPIIQEGINYINQTDFSRLAPGKYDIIPDKMFCLLQETATVPVAQMRAESHFNFVDIQYLISGEESIGVARGAKEHTVIENKAAQNDIVFYTDTRNESFIHLLPGMFAVFFPEDLHRPCCQTHGESFIRKAVIKIHLSLFTENK